MIESFTSLISPSDGFLQVLPWILLYPETHYRFRFFPFSLYYRRQPEILFDVPHRLEPGKPLPVLLMIRDAHRFPIKISTIILKAENGSTLEVSLNKEITDSWWHQIWEYPIAEDGRGRTIGFQAELLGVCGKKSVRVCQDNLVGLPHRPFRVHLAKDPLPCPEGWVAGDMHVHSDYTSDQVEFGVPLNAMTRLAQASGLSFAAVNDHSYDLDDDEKHYLKNDLDLPKWRKFQQEIAERNAQLSNFVLIPGEEVTARNHLGKNVHCLVLYEPSYIPGSGDSAERWFRTRSEHALAEIPALLSEEALMIAAHPMEPVPLLQQWLIGRGNWSTADCSLPGLHGLQILNGFRDKSFYDGLRQWQRLLIEGKKFFLFGGNDAHGNFNRFRQVRIPMITLIEREQYQIFGQCKTFVYLGDQSLSPQSLKQALRQGRAIISDGPFLELSVVTPEDRHALIGDRVRGNSLSIQIHCRSTSEFGTIQSTRIRYGRIGYHESILAEWGPNDFIFKEKISLNEIVNGYIRAELETSKAHFAYTNPIWIEPLPTIF